VKISVLVYTANTVTDSGDWSGKASVNNFSKIVVPVSQQVASADSVMISITGGFKAGTVLNVDNLSLVKYTQ
jgi:hypothetical protein